MYARVKNIMCLFACPLTHPLSSSEIFDSIQQNQSHYEKQILKKSLETFVGDKFKKPKFQNSKPVSLVHQSQQKQRADAEYYQLFHAQLEKKMQALYGIYMNAFAGGKLGSSEKGIVVIGSSELRTPLMESNFGHLDETREGCVFVPNHWDLLKNDLMILGAIHAHKVFILQYSTKTNAVEDDERAQFWDPTQNAPKTLAREVLMLLAAGYKVWPYKDEDKLGRVFVCTDPEKASAFTLKKANQSVSAIDKKARDLPEELRRSYYSV